MPYDRFGRTPALSRRQRFYDWLCVAALILMLVCVIAIATLVVLVIGA